MGKFSWIYSEDSLHVSESALIMPGVVVEVNHFLDMSFFGAYTERMGKYLF